MKSSQHRSHTAIMEKLSYGFGRFLTNNGIGEEVVDTFIENEVTG